MKDDAAGASRRSLRRSRAQVALRQVAGLCCERLQVVLIMGASGKSQVDWERLGRRNQEVQQGLAPILPFDG